MSGALLLVLVVVVVIPVGVLVSGAAMAAILGRSLLRNAEATHPDSELTDLNT